MKMVRKHQQQGLNIQIIIIGIHLQIYQPHRVNLIMYALMVVMEKITLLKVNISSLYIQFYVGWLLFRIFIDYIELFQF